jgi:hypothetical protein
MGFQNEGLENVPLYAAEFQYRYNNRNNPDMFEQAIAGC